MQASLELEDLWGCILGEEGYVKDIKKDTRARSKIILSLDTTNFIYIRKTRTAKETWEKLLQTFEDTGFTRKVGLLRKLVTTQLDKSSSVDEYVNAIMTTVHSLNELGFNVDNEWVGTLFLAVLSDEYRPIIMALENSGARITGDFVKVKLLQEVKAHASIKSSD